MAYGTTLYSYHWQFFFWSILRNVIYLMKQALRHRLVLNVQRTDATDYHMVEITLIRRRNFFDDKIAHYSCVYLEQNPVSGSVSFEPA